MIKGVLVYSEENIKPELIAKPEWDNREISVTCVSNINELILKLDCDITDLVIIDTRTDIANKTLRDLLTFCASHKLPILFHDLRNIQEIQLSYFLPKTSFKFAKLVLRRTESENAANDRLNLDIMNQTAATLSHEINNPLMAITANIEMILSSAKSLPQGIEEKIEQISIAARRIRSVTDDLINLEDLNFRETAAGRMIQFEEKGKHELAERVAE